MKRTSLPLCAQCVLLLLLFSCRKIVVNEKTPAQTQALASAAAASTVNIQTFDLPIRVDTPFVWGVNGHPLTQVQYWGNLPVQMSLLRELQNTYYRVDFNADSTGYVSSPYLNALFTYAADSNINILPVIPWPNPQEIVHLTPAQAYTAGQTLMQGFMQNYGSHFTGHYYELGNEEESYCLIPRAPDGDNPANYDRTLLASACSYFDGMIAAVKAADPAARTIINSGNHTIFFHFLDSAAVPFDIIGYHFYNGVTTSMGLNSKIAALNAYPQPVWFTEINDEGSLNYPDAQADSMELYIQALDQQTKIRGFFVYELFNQDDQLAPESVLGMTSWFYPFNYTSAIVRKPEFEKYKFKIEEQKNGWYDLAYSTFLYCDFRQPDPGGLQFWTNWLILHRNIPEMFEIILPQENYSRWVNQQFLLFLNRPADSTALAYFTQELVNGSTRESIINTIVCSAEFLQLSGNTDTGFLNRTYDKLLNRGPNATESASWLSSLNSNFSQAARSTVSASIQAGTEFQGQYVLAEYNAVLRRDYNVTQDEINAGVNLMQGGMTQLDFYKTLLNTYEFYQRAIEEGYERNNPGYAFWPNGYLIFPGQ